MKEKETVLNRIVRTKQEEVAAAKARLPLENLRAQAADAPTPRDFFAALNEPAEISLIAEVKKASPSAGLIRADFQHLEIAQTYQTHGAACISVLTDEQYFQGSLDYLREVRAAVDIPVLRKDFIIDSYQLWEARAHGADAVLLIAECLDDCALRSLYNETLDLGMVALIELYEPRNLPRVLETGTTLLGVNNRNLHNFEVDLEHTLRLRKEIPDSCVLVGESGIKTREDALLLEENGVDAMLVGESLMRQKNIGSAVDALLGR